MLTWQTVKADASSLGLAEVRGTGRFAAASLEAAEVEVSAGGHLKAQKSIFPPKYST